MTLADIGDRRHVTRERIRQIEARALRELRRCELSSPIKSTLIEEADEIWEQLAAPEFAVRADSSESDLLSRLDPDCRLAFVVCELSIGEYLNEIARSVDRGWYRSPIDPYLLERVCFQLEHDESGPYPTPIEVAAARIGASVLSVRMAATLSDSIHAYQNYIWKGRLAARVRRAIWLHRILASLADRTAVSTYELVAIHNRLRPQATCSYRDAEIVLARHTHLFIQLGKGAWAGAGGVALKSLVDADQDDLCLTDDDEQDLSEATPGTAVGTISSILQEHGPMRLSDIVSLFEARATLKGTSVGPILISHGEFVRMAPGVYALPEHVSDSKARTEARALLLNSESCAEYARAIYSGEPRDTFPLWTNRMEHDWCEWAKGGADPEVFSSLLSVVAPEDWNHATPTERAEWIETRQRQADYRIDRDVEIGGSKREVTLREILVPALYATRHGHVGWVTINRLHGDRCNDSSGKAYLGLLVAAGVVKALDDWRCAHPLLESGHALCASLLHELERTGHLQWDSPVGESLTDRLLDALSHSNGWVKDETAEALTRILPKSRRERISAVQVTCRAIIEIGIAIAQVDGYLDNREIERIRSHALEYLGGLKEAAVPLVDSIIKQTRETSPRPLEVARTLAQTLAVRERHEVMKHLFQLASADGIFHESEGRLLVSLQKALDVEPEYFELLYRTHARDPRAGAEELSARLRNAESCATIDELVSLLTLC